MILHTRRSTKVKIVVQMFCCIKKMAAKMFGIYLVTLSVVLTLYISFCYNRWKERFGHKYFLTLSKTL